MDNGWTKLNGTGVYRFVTYFSTSTVLWHFSHNGQILQYGHFTVNFHFLQFFWPRSKLGVQRDFGKFWGHFLRAIHYSCNIKSLIGLNCSSFSYFRQLKKYKFWYFFRFCEIGQWPTISDSKFNTAIVLPTFSSSNSCPYWPAQRFLTPIFFHFHPKFPHFWLLPNTRRLSREFGGGWGGVPPCLRRWSRWGVVKSTWCHKRQNALNGEINWPINQECLNQIECSFLHLIGKIFLFDLV
jgi:hypothetical protein